MLPCDPRDVKLARVRFPSSAPIRGSRAIARPQRAPRRASRAAHRRGAVLARVLRTGRRRHFGVVRARSVSRPGRRGPWSAGAPSAAPSSGGRSTRYMSNSGHQVYPTTATPPARRRSTVCDGCVEPIDPLGRAPGHAGLGHHDRRLVALAYARSISVSPPGPIVARRPRVGEATAVMDARFEHLGRVPRVVVHSHDVGCDGAPANQASSSSSTPVRRTAGDKGWSAPTRPVTRSSTRNAWR